MKKLKSSTVAKIYKNGEVVRTIKTPKGIMKVWELEEKRGYQTNFTVKKFSYVELPCSGGFFTYKSSFEDFWRKKGFI